MRDECASCLGEIELDEDRYERQGNYCNKCMAKISRDMETKKAEARYKNALYTIRGSDNGYETV